MPVLWIVFHKYYLSIGILYVVLGYTVTVLQNMWFSPWELKGQLSSQVLKAMLIPEIICRSQIVLIFFYVAAIVSNIIVQHKSHYSLNFCHLYLISMKFWMSFIQLV